MSLLLARQNRLQRVAGLGDLGKVNLGAKLFAAGAMSPRRAARLMEVAANLLGLVFLD
jgi:hypothetical protein